MCFRTSAQRLTRRSRGSFATRSSAGVIPTLSPALKGGQSRATMQLESSRPVPPQLQPTRPPYPVAKRLPPPRGVSNTATTLATRQAPYHCRKHDRRHIPRLRRICEGRWHLLPHPWNGEMSRTESIAKRPSTRHRMEKSERSIRSSQLICVHHLRVDDVQRKSPRCKRKALSSMVHTRQRDDTHPHPKDDQGTSDRSLELGGQPARVTWASAFMI